ncbi:hypothetical protein Glove_209g125 [Diversispora epigaea]|uniref:Uncharacterized protein n=1 Tax=Diversispora epigaea TaxID=1348612 RepID=A0A397INL5_9GLOM|nr:hypothetical protein Glove_209g125 [Diversispora epigaea]
MISPTLVALVSQAMKTVSFTDDDDEVLTMVTIHVHYNDSTVPIENEEEEGIYDNSNDQATHNDNDATNKLASFQKDVSKVPKPRYGSKSNQKKRINISTFSCSIFS